jgi:hypothetical protein
MLGPIVDPSEIAFTRIMEDDALGSLRVETADGGNFALLTN